MNLEELKAKVLDEYKKVKREWEDGKYYFRAREYFKRFSMDSWIRMVKYERVCMVISLSRLGLPITSSILSWFFGLSHQVSTETLRSLSALGVLEPMGLHSFKKVARRYKLNPRFIRAIYSHLEKGNKLSET